MVKAILILVITIIICSSVIVYLWAWKISYYDSRLDQFLSMINDLNTNQKAEALNWATNSKLQNEITALKLEKETYNQMINRESDRMVLYVSILFAIFGIVGLTVSNRISQHIKEDYIKNNSEYETKYRKIRFNQNRFNKKIISDFITHKNEINDLQIDYLQTSGNMWVISSSIFEGLPAFRFWSRLNAIEYFIKCAELRKDKEHNFIIIKSNLESLRENISELKKQPELFIEFYEEDSDNKLRTSIMAFNTIIKFENEIISKIGVDIFSTFNFLVKILKSSKTQNDA